MTRLAPLTALYVLLNSTGLLVLRSALKSSHQDGLGLLQTVLRPPTVLGIACYGISFVTFAVALRFHPLTTVFPLFAGFGYAAVALGGWLVLGETVSGVKLAGLAAIGLGVVLVQVG